MTRDNSNLAENISAKHLALSPLDGRYAEIQEILAPYFSEYALMWNRVRVEVFWLKFLLANVDSSDILKDFNKAKIPAIVEIYTNFSDDSYMRIKEIESETNHDVKSVEIFVAEKLKEMGMESLISFVHIGCTSEDITNSSYASMIYTALREIWIPHAMQLIRRISEIAKAHADTAMLTHTHGQQAIPTTVGKEMGVYVYRLKKSLENIKSIKICAKFNGSTGNYSSISVAFPNENWPELSKNFIDEYLGLTFNPVTTQIESHDDICHIIDGIRHFNNVLRDFNLDMCLYSNMDYFKQTVAKNEMDSSTMPHKVNSICFKNSEANIKMGNDICYVLSEELSRSRMQRDLSDSSLQRNIGLAFGYSLQAIKQTIDELKKVTVNIEKISSDLDSKWEVLAEPIQTVLRKYGIPYAYNKLKELTREKDISKEAIQEFIKSLDVISDEDKQTLMELSPAGYIGLASEIVRDATTGF